MSQESDKTPAKGYAKAIKQFDIDGRVYNYYSVKVFDNPDGNLSERLPRSLKLMFENLLRNYDGRSFLDKHLNLFKSWQGIGGVSEISFMPSRVILQDFTGVPVVADLAAMRDEWQAQGGDPEKINPVIPVDLVIDHSVMIDCFGSSEALQCNIAHEYERNQERYRFLKWAQNSFARFRAFPPSAGIIHQVNLEHLAEVVSVEEQDGALWLKPDTLVGTDSHTTMINGIGVPGWGVGGIEAEAAMLGQPLSLLLPNVVGMKLTGKLNPGVTATDLALTVTNILRSHGVVGCFVEYFGDGIHNISVEDRATVANMSPEYGATMGFFPVDSQTLAYLESTGRTPEQIRLVEQYCRLQGLYLEAGQPDPVYSQVLELDLGSVRPSLAGPKRPQDLVYLDNLKESAVSALMTPVSDGGFGQTIDSIDRKVDIVFADGRNEALADGSVVIAAITSCTNTSNPAVMIGAGLLAKRACERGLRVPVYVKTSLAPGSRVVTAYLDRAGLTPYLEKLGFHTAGYGCTTCIGNSGPLIPEVSAAIDENSLNVASVLSGNRNFEGRVHPQVKMNFLASPILVVAYALAGNVRINLTEEPLGQDADGQAVYLRDIWPTDQEIEELVRTSVRTEFFDSEYKAALTANESWNNLEGAQGNLYAWEEKSTYIRKPPFVENMSAARPALQSPDGARVLLWLGDSVTTDHISPAGNIAAESPAGRYLQEQGVTPEKFNSYGSRRGNHEVMIRGTFANIRIRNKLVPEKEGGFTRLLPDGEILSVFDASERYIADKVPLIVIAGKEYGSGSSRDWAAKGTALLGVRAVIAQSYEWIHRSNLIGMGVLPLQFFDGQSAEGIGLSGTEIFRFPDYSHNVRPQGEMKIIAEREDGSNLEFSAIVRIDSEVELDMLLHGGILPQVLRQFAAET